MGLKESSGDLFKFIIYLIVIILINMAAYTLFFRIDLTSNRAYSLSDISKEVVSTLSEPLTIHVFFSFRHHCKINKTFPRPTTILKNICATCLKNTLFPQINTSITGFTT